MCVLSSYYVPGTVWHLSYISHLSLTSTLNMRWSVELFTDEDNEAQKG